MKGPQSSAVDSSKPKAVSAPEDEIQSRWNRVIERRSFLKGMGVAGAAMLPGGAILASQAAARERDSITKGDVAILRFLAAAEIIESDLWQQYTELGGVAADAESPGVQFTTGNAAYTAALQALDNDMPQYITDNTDDEFSHAAFLNAYLAAHGADQVNLDEFRTLPSSQADGANKSAKRLTNLMNLNVDTSWYTRYRSTTNPDLGANPGQALVIQGQPAIPTDNDDTSNSSRIQAIANTAAFHFCFIEQGGSSLYTTLVQQCSSVEVLRIVASIGGVEVDHFSLWHDKVGNAVSPPVAPVTDPETNLTFPNFNANRDSEHFQTNLILAEPTDFISTSLPKVSVIRPSSTANSGAVAAVNAFAGDNLFDGQKDPKFMHTLMDLAKKADAARREVSSSD